MALIFIADDEPHVAHVLSFALERAGFEVRTFLSGAQALQAVRECAPDALITDIQMPVMSGKALCQAIQAEMPQRQFPIFVMTSMTNREHRDWTAAIPDLRFLEKPVSLRLLVQTLRTRLGSRQADATP